MSHTFIRAFENRKKPILARNKPVERIHFNIVKLAAGETYQYRLPGMESVVVPMGGTCDLTVDGTSFLNVGRRSSVWDGKAEAVYAGPAAEVVVVGQSGCEIAIAGGLWDQRMVPFRITPEEVDVGSNETKSRRRIFHILGQNGAGRAGNLLVSELYADEGCWSGYPPHKHDVDQPGESDHQEVYHWRFKPPTGFGAQLWYSPEGEATAYVTRDGDTFAFSAGYHHHGDVTFSRILHVHYSGRKNATITDSEF
jgi:5-deoxy-glucuronate isomerase